MNPARSARAWVGISLCTPHAADVHRPDMGKTRNASPRRAKLAAMPEEEE
ncbi:MAG: hypothetical protein M3Y58_10055 [Chloroflexota bacterium]|nr:hypothetical protein [Chloroflexota bacterium]